MQRDATSLRNIGIMSSVDAGSTRARECIIELVGRAPSSDGRRASDDGFVPGAIVPAKIGSWVPRSGPFAGETTRIAIVGDAPRVIDGALIVLDGARGPAEAAEASLRYVCGRRVPAVVFVDDVGSLHDLETLASTVESDLGAVAVVVHVPWRGEGGPGIIDVLEQRLVASGSIDGDRELRPVPASARRDVERLRQRIIDVCAEHDESVLGASATGLGVGADDLARALRRATLSRESRVLVVACGWLRGGRGAGLLLDALVTYLPSPAERPPVFGLDPRRSVTVARFAREGDALAALVFATSDEPALGRLAWLRIHSGTLHVTDPVLVLPRDRRSRVERIFTPDASGLVEKEDAGPGAIVCVTGPAEARPGDTVACVRAPVVLDETHVPARTGPAGPTRLATDDGIVAPHARTVWSVARGLRSTLAEAAGLRRTRG